MCLNYSKTMTNRYKKMTEPIIAYKMVVKNTRNKMFTPYKNILIQPLINQSNRSLIDLTDREKKYGCIHFGCHLFLNKKDAILNQKYHPDEAKSKFSVLEVKIEPKDVVAAGYFSICPPTVKAKSIVCTEYFISQEEYDRAKKEL